MITKTGIDLYRRFMGNFLSPEEYIKMINQEILDLETAIFNDLDEMYPNMDTDLFYEVYRKLVVYLSGVESEIADEL